MKLADWGRAGIRKARLTRMGVAALAAILLALAAAGTATALTAHGAQRPLASAPRLPVGYNGLDGWAHGRVRLAVIYIGGTTAFLRTPRWTRWTGSSAYTRGTLWVDNCRPDCAGGHFRTYPAQVTLSGAADRKGVAFFSRMRLRYYHGGLREYGFRWGTYRGATVPLWIGGPG